MGQLRIRRSHVYRTFCIEYGRTGFVLGFSGLDRPSVWWHLVLRYRRLQHWIDRR